jgi:hypothetical protein
VGRREVVDIAADVSGRGCDDLLGLGPTEIWGFGGRGLAVWNGREWTMEPDGPAEIDIAPLGGSSRAELWAVGTHGIIPRRRE